MIYLDNITRKLQAVLAGVAATTNPKVLVCFADKGASTYNGGPSLTQLNGVTAVDIAPAPGASTIREVNYISLYNNDTASVVVTFRYNDNGTITEMATFTVAPKEKVEYTHSKGWSVIQSGVAGPQGVQGPVNALGNLYTADFSGSLNGSLTGAL